MTQTFSYKEKFSWSFIFLALLGLTGIVYALLIPFNLKFKNFTVLQYPYSKYMVFGLGILLMAYAIHKCLKMSVINSVANIIVVTDHQFTFYNLEGYALRSKTVSFFEVNELWSKTANKDGESMIIYSQESKNRYEFFAENFESGAEFADFKKWLELKCTNITNLYKQPYYGSNR